MASVEDIYRKIRRGETHDLRFMRVTDKELSEGVERIRARLAGDPVTRQSGFRGHGREAYFASGYHPFRSQWLWLTGAAIAAAAVVTFVILRPTVPLADSWTKGGTVLSSPQSISLNAGDEIRVGVKFRLHAFSSTTVQILADEGKTRQIRVTSGTVLAERLDSSFVVTLSTYFSKLNFAGTRFILQTSSASEALYLFEGRLVITTAQKEMSLDADAENTLMCDKKLTHIRKMSVTEFARNRPELIKNAASLPEFAKRAPVSANAEQKPSGTGSYAKGDCILYYRNNERRRGKIYAREGTGYVIEGTAGREPGVYYETDLFRDECAQ